MNIARTVLTAAALVGAATSANAATNIVTNGNFDAGLSGFAETPGPEIDVANGAVYAGCCNVSGLNGDNNNNFATFGGGGQPDISTLSQVLGTVVGQSYVLSFRATALGSGTAGFQAQVLNGSTLLGTLTTTVTAGAPYVTYLLGFIAQSTSTTIAF